MSDMTIEEVEWNIKSTPWNIVGLQLCQCSYQPTKQEIIESVPLVAMSWPKIVRWGTSENTVCSSGTGEVVFVAESRILSGMVVAIAIVIRGTDFDTSIEGMFDEIDDDLNVLVQRTPPWLASSNIKISKGAFDDYQDIAAFRFGPSQQSLNDYIVGRLRACKAEYDRYPSIVVTGHSLGGCQVSVVAASLAAYLRDQNLDLSILPISYAAPTAGNAAFASYFHGLCPTNRRISNTLDIIPHGWAALENIQFIYDKCPIDPAAGMPPDLRDTIKSIAQFLKVENFVYKQPDTVKHLTGQCLTKTIGRPSWIASAAHQHHTTTYMALLGGTDIPTIGASVEPAG